MSKQNGTKSSDNKSITSVYDKRGIKKVFDTVTKDLWIVILDLIAVNLSYFLALMIRFYVNNQFRPTVKYYLTDFTQFAPFYTILCIVVFAWLKLYNGMWRYAGINDMNRIIGASLITSIIQVVGTLLFIRRMPITYYIIGALLQFVFVVIIRFTYRFLIVEHKKIASRKLPAVNVMVIGTGEIGRRVIKQLEDDSAYRPVCVIDSKSDTDGKTFDGIPVLSGAAQVENAISKYGVKAVFIADPVLSADSRNAMKNLCESRGLDLQDYTGFLSNLSGRLSLTCRLEAARCPVTINNGDRTDEYANGYEALQHLTDRYTVSSVTANGSRLVLDVSENKSEAYTGYEAWLQKHKEETGEEVSYF